MKIRFSRQTEENEIKKNYKIFANELWKALSLFVYISHMTAASTT